jgi:hypothetical protein
MSKPVYIRIDRPEEYDEVADELLIEDWIGCLKGGAMSAKTGGVDWRQVAAPVDITDAMVEAACEAHLREWAARVLDGYAYSAADIDDDARACMRAALRAAMGAQ